MVAERFGFLLRMRETLSFASVKTKTLCWIHTVPSSSCKFCVSRFGKSYRGIFQIILERFGFSVEKAWSSLLVRVILQPSSQEFGKGCHVMFIGRIF